MGFPFPIFIKASRSKISVSKEIREVNRLRLQFERSMTARLMAVFKRVGKRAADEYTQSESVSDALRPLEGELEQVFRAHHRAVIEKFGDRVYENRKQERFAQLIFSYYSMEGAQKVRGVTVQTANLIRRAIRAGEVEGEGVAKIAKRIREKTDGAIGRARSSTIARTETHAAASYATHEATKELGLPAQRKRWVSVSDGRTRSHHAAANGQEVGMDEPFIIRFNGQEIKMMYPHDGSGGPANNINCRCLALYFSDEDALFDNFVDDPVAPVVPVVPVEPEPVVPVAPVSPVAPSVDPFGPTAAFVFPRLNGLNQNNIPVRKKSVVRKELSLDMAEGAGDGRYAFVPRFQSRSSGDHGKFTIGNGSDEAYSFVGQAIKEVDYMAQYIGVPRLRGVKGTTSNKLNGSQGGGIMALNPKSIDVYTAQRRGDTELLGGQASLDKLDEEIARANGKREELYGAWRAAKLNNDDELRDRLKRELDDLRIDTNNKIDRYNQIVSVKGTGGELNASTYELGGDIKDRPWSTKQYFPDGLDKARTLIYHEFGHHIHQNYKLDVMYRNNGSPLEKRLRMFWLTTDKKVKEYYAPSSYAMTNEKEYFVETFAMYMMGRTDIAHPAMIELIEEILRDRGK
jgi:hypothetical protein